MKNKLDEKMHIYSSSYVNKHNLLGLIMLIKILYRIFVFSLIFDIIIFLETELLFNSASTEQKLIILFWCNWSDLNTYGLLC